MFLGRPHPSAALPSPLPLLRVLYCTPCCRARHPTPPTHPAYIGRRGVGMGRSARQRRPMEMSGGVWSGVACPVYMPAASWASLALVNDSTDEAHSQPTSDDWLLWVRPSPSLAGAHPASIACLSSLPPLPALQLLPRWLSNHRPPLACLGGVIQGCTGGGESDQGGVVDTPPLHLMADWRR